MLYKNHQLSDSVYIVKNAVKSDYQPTRYADLCQQITRMKIKYEAEFLRQPRFNEALIELTFNDRIAMYQAGAKNYRNKYDSGQFVSAGIVIEKARYINPEDIKKYQDLYNLSKIVYGPDLVGIIFYSFPKGVGNTFLERENIGFDPRKYQGKNFIEVSIKNPHFLVINKWWHINYGSKT